MKKAFRLIHLIAISLMAWACNSGKDAKDDCPNPVAGVCSETNSTALGKIADSDGKPVAGAKVVLIGVSVAKTAKRSALSRAAADSALDSLVTGSDGAFEFDSLVSGSYRVKAVKDTFGVVQDFSLGEGEKKDLGTLTIINNGIIIGKVDRSIVQQAENAYAVITEIGVQTNVTQEGNYTFNNVPTYNNYTIVIVSDGKTIPSSLDGKEVKVESGKATQIQDEGGITIVPREDVTIGMAKNIVLRESAPAKSFADLAKSRRITVLESDEDTAMVFTRIKDAATTLRLDSLPRGEDLVVVSEWLDANGTPHYTGNDTLDILGQGRDTVYAAMQRITGRLSADFTFLASDSSALSGADFDTAWMEVSGRYTDTLKSGFAPNAQGRYATNYSGIPSRVRLQIAIFATDAEGRSFTGKDSVTVSPDSMVSFTLKGICSKEAPQASFTVRDTVVEVGDSATAVLEWRNKPESTVVALRSLSTTILGVSGEKYFGVRAGTANVVVTATGAAKPDTFQVRVAEKEFSVPDMDMEVDDTARAVIAWKTKAPAAVAANYRSVNTTLATVVAATGHITARAAGDAQIIVSVTGVTKPDTFVVHITEPVRSYTLKLDTNAFEVVQGGDGRTKARLVRTKLPAAITFSAPALPEGVTVAFAPATITADTSVMTITVTTNAIPGDYRFGVIARTAGYTDRVDSVSLKVTRDNSMEWVKISAGYDHTCAINKADDAYCWGTNAYGQLGIGTVVAQTRPTLVIGGLKWASINSGNSVSCGITKTGVGYCWGYGAAGMLGNGGTTNAPEPTAISVTGGDLWSQLSVGHVSVCGVTTDGRGYCWGWNTYGQIGDSTVTTKVTRSQVKGSMVWKKIETGGSNANYLESTCGITSENEIYCWGYNGNGELGDGNPGNGANPVPVKLLVSKPWTDIEMGTSYVCANTADGEAYCWGNNYYGQLGVGDNVNRTTPTLVLNDIKWARITGGAWTTCGLDTQSKAYCWGTNGYGQIGNGATSTAQTAPALVSGNQVWLDVGSGQNRTCGVNQYNQAYCWGSGNLGAGNTTSSLKPWRVSEPLAP